MTLEKKFTDILDGESYLNRVRNIAKNFTVECYWDDPPIVWSGSYPSLRIDKDVNNVFSIYQQFREQNGKADEPLPVMYHGLPSSLDLKLTLELANLINSETKKSMLKNNDAINKFFKDNLSIEEFKKELEQPKQHYSQIKEISRAGEFIVNVEDEDDYLVFSRVEADGGLMYKARIRYFDEEINNMGGSFAYFSNNGGKIPGYTIQGRTFCSGEVPLELKRHMQTENFFSAFGITKEGKYDISLAISAYHKLEGISRTLEHCKMHLGRDYSKEEKNEFVGKLQLAKEELQVTLQTETGGKIAKTYFPNTIIK